MKPLKKRAWALILIVLGVALTVPSLKADENTKQDESQNKSRKAASSNAQTRQPLERYSSSRKDAAFQDERGTEKMPLVIKGIPAEKTAEQVAEDRKERDLKTAIDGELVSYTGWQAKSAAVLIFVGICQLGLFAWQLRLIQNSLTDTKTAAEAAKVNAQAALEQAKAITLSERAYVGMSHTPDGLKLLDSPNSGYMVEMEIRNVGRTPTTITDVVLGISILGESETLPATLNYPVNAPELLPHTTSWQNFICPLCERGTRFRQWHRGRRQIKD